MLWSVEYYSSVNLILLQCCQTCFFKLGSYCDWGWKFNWNENPNLYFQKQKQNMKKEEAREGIICRYIWTCVSSQDVLWARNGKIVKLDRYKVLVTRFHQRIKSAFNSAPLGFVLSQKFKEKNYFDIYAKQFVASINCTIVFIFFPLCKRSIKHKKHFKHLVNKTNLNNIR